MVCGRHCVVKWYSFPCGTIPPLSYQVLCADVIPPPYPLSGWLADGRTPRVSFRVTTPHAPSNTRLLIDVLRWVHTRTDSGEHHTLRDFRGKATQEQKRVMIWKERRFLNELVLLWMYYRFKTLRDGIVYPQATITSSNVYCWCASSWVWNNPAKYMDDIRDFIVRIPFFGIVLYIYNTKAACPSGLSPMCSELSMYHKWTLR